jgi:hypothetical protein
MRRLLKGAAALLLLAAIALGVRPLLVSQPVEAASNVTTFAATMPRYLQRGQTLAGLGPDTAYEWEDFFQLPAPGGSVGGWTATIVGTGTISATTSGFRHTWRIGSGATGSSTAQLRGGGNDVASTSTDRFYVVSRFKVATAITAQTMAYVGLWDSGASNSVTMGVIGALNTTNFIVQHSGMEGGSSIDLGVAINTNFHVFEAWGRGTTQLCGRVDNAAVVCGTQSSAGTNMMPVVVVRNGTDAVARNLDVDWLLLATGRTP